MQQKMKMVVLGVRHFNDTVEGTKYDFTKLRLMMPVSTSSGLEVGQGETVIEFGKSDNFAKIKDHTYPCEAELDIELTTKGFTCHGFKYLAAANILAKAA